MFNLYATRLVLEGLAVLHGTTHVMIKESEGVDAFRAKYADTLEGTLYDQKDDEWKTFLEPSMTQAIKALKVPSHTKWYCLTNIKPKLRLIEQAKNGLPLRFKRSPN